MYVMEVRHGEHVFQARSVHSKFSGANPPQGKSRDWSKAKFGLSDFDGCLCLVEQDGTSSTDRPDAIAAVGTDGSIVLAGWTSGDWDAANEGDGDFAAVKLDADGVQLWTWQV